MGSVGFWAKRRLVVFRERKKKIEKWVDTVEGGCYIDCPHGGEGENPTASSTEFERNGVWPSGKAPGFGPGILGSNPSTPVWLEE